MARTTSHGIVNGGLGLSLSSSRVPKKMQFVSTFIQQKFEHPTFALNFVDDVAKLEIGHAKQAFEYHKVVKTIGKRERQWQLKSCSIFVDDELIVSNIKTVFDSSYDRITGPGVLVDQIREKVRYERGDGQGHPVAYFQWEGGEKWPLLQVIHSLSAKFI
ncbi:hypothetical protein APHAL10511_006714 [Amanita phalloides]|nr:hypothetical protein APHAL10511_006714 [Amanita phalloides]